MERGCLQLGMWCVATGGDSRGMTCVIFGGVRRLRDSGMGYALWRSRFCWGGAADGSIFGLKVRPSFNDGCLAMVF